MARALAALGVGHADRVVAWNDTTLDVLPLFVALAKLGAVFAPISPLLAPEEAEVMITAAKPTAIVVDAERAADGAAVAARIGVPFVELAGLRSDDGRRRRRTSRDSARPTRTSCSSPAGAPDARRARCSRTA